MKKDNYLKPLLRAVQCLHDMYMMASTTSGSLEDFDEVIVIED